MGAVRVAFLHIGYDIKLAELMAQSVRRSIPGAVIVQMSDEATPEVAGVDECWRSAMRSEGAFNRYDDDSPGSSLPKAMMTFRMKMLSRLDNAPTVILDTDVIVQKDLSSLFDDPDFDVAMTRREPGSVKAHNGDDVSKMMPYNTGVMFSRRARFWRDCETALQRMSPEVHDWWGDQLAVARVAPGYRVRDLSVSQWNYTPRSKDDPIEDKAVIHYKGKRKEWMLERWG